jgi:hypothetical protein
MINKEIRISHNQKSYYHNQGPNYINNKYNELSLIQKFDYSHN